MFFLLAMQFSDYLKRKDNIFAGFRRLGLILLSRKEISSDSVKSKLSKFRTAEVLVYRCPPFTKHTLLQTDWFIGCKTQLANSDLGGFTFLSALMGFVDKPRHFEAPGKSGCCSQKLSTMLDR